MSDPRTIVIIGGGHAAAQLCAGLAEAGLGPQLHLVADEPVLPYQRPPLSKAYLKNPAETLQHLRAEAWYRDAGITVHLAQRAVAIDRAAHRVLLASSQALAYSQLVLATGTRARRLPLLPEGLANVAQLRTAADAQVLREQLAQAEQLTVVGGGFIGLEIAATARALGKAVTALEAAPRLLARSVSPEIAAHVLDTHRAAGIDVRLSAHITKAEMAEGRLLALQVDGQRLPVGLVLLGIGAEPEQALAQAAGLACDNGVVVDALMRTSDPDILAVGDCSNFPEPVTGRRLRLESVQNANDQARTAVATLLGRDKPYKALPWFWSDQGSLRLQMAGLAPADGQRYLRPGATTASFSVLHYRSDALVCVESVNAPLDHITARKLLEAGKHPTPALACDPAVPLKNHL